MYKFDCDKSCLRLIISELIEIRAVDFDVPTGAGPSIRFKSVRIDFNTVPV